MKQVSRRVAKATGEKQVPAIYGLMLEDVVLRSFSSRVAALVGTPVKSTAGMNIKMNPKDNLVYSWIPPGRFMRGCSPDDGECLHNEVPPVEVIVEKGFWMGQTLVTQTAYKRVIGTDPSVFKGWNLPVESVNWEESGKYCAGIGGRLPSNNEWEYAARAGTTGKYYGKLEDISWHAGRIDHIESSTHPVAQKSSNAFFLFDMLGDVFQWTQERCWRGGSSGSARRFLRVSYRIRYDEKIRSKDGGFRCVLGHALR